MAGHLFRIEGVGEVLFERSRRATRINISVRPFKGIRVAVPYGVSYAKARMFAVSKKHWIQKHLEKMRTAERDHKDLSHTFNTLDRRKAGKILVQRLEELARKHGFKYNRVFIRNQKTRWGSCSSKDNISLNVKLVCLPEKLMDYIILHELVHTRVKNHGKTYYAALDRIVGDRKSLDRELKRYAMVLGP
jgi:predicted metal-dependent hydrolase